MKDDVEERLKKLADELGYSYEEMGVKGIQAVLEWIDAKDEKRIPEFILEVRKKQSELKRS